MAIISSRPKLVLVLGFISIVSLLIAVVSIGLKRLDTIGSKLGLVVNQHSVQASHIQNMVSSALERTILLSNIAVSNDTFLREELVDSIYKLGGQFMHERQALIALGVNEAEQVLLDEQKKYTAQVLPFQYQVIELARSGKQHDAIHFMYTSAIPAQSQVVSTLNKLSDLQFVKSRDELHVAGNEYQKTRQQILITSICALILGIGIIVYAVRKIEKMTVDISLGNTKLNKANQVLKNKIIELSSAQYRLSQSEMQERIIRENIMDAVITINDRGIIDSCNPAAEIMFGYSADEMLGSNVSMLMPDPHQSRHDDYITEFMQGKRENVLGMTRDLTGIRKNGEIFPVDIGITKVEIDGRVKIIGILRDITERKHAEQLMQNSREELERLVEERTDELVKVNEKLTYMANYDGLTDLPNRSMFYEHLKKSSAHALRNNQLLALLFLDLDGFKPVNDEYGHEAGDLVLKEIARRLKSTVRDEDTVARLGGDEFVVVLGGLTSGDYAAIVAEKLLQKLSIPVVYNKYEITVSGSIGISVFPEDSNDLDDLLRIADDAMYRVKRTGKNHFEFFNSSIYS